MLLIIGLFSAMFWKTRRATEPTACVEYVTFEGKSAVPTTKVPRHGHWAAILVFGP